MSVNLVKAWYFWSDSRSKKGDTPKEISNLYPIAHNNRNLYFDEVRFLSWEFREKIKGDK